MAKNFKVGDKVKVKENLVIGNSYFMGDGVMCATFTKFMNTSKGKEATITSIRRGMYEIDVDVLHSYTDEMLDGLVDENPKNDYNFSEESEALINHVSKLIPKQQIDYALDTKNKAMFEALMTK